MSHFERLLQDDLNRLVDRVAARAGEGTAAGLKSDLRTRVERSEERLTALRAVLLDGYAEWERAMDECEDLWALAALRDEALEVPTQLRAA
jgi:gamma-glutamyl:cysteine ligase YbdK (ATP-grasp superfamily)